MKLDSAYTFTFQDLQKEILSLYGQSIDILDTIPDEWIGHCTYHTYTVDGESELDSIGDDEVVKVWTETGQTTGIDMSNDPEWDAAWTFNCEGDLEVKHILHRMLKEGHIPAGKYIMLVDW